MAAERTAIVDRWDLDHGEVYRLAALGGLGVVSLASVVVLYEITVVLGGSTQLLVRLGLAIALAWLAARLLEPRIALVIFAGLAVGGYAWYFAIAMADVGAVLSTPLTVAISLVNDALLIVTGLSVLAIRATDVWALSFAPAPVFLTWYLGFRRRYAHAAAIGGATMGLFVLSGDLEVVWTIVGALGAVLTVGFGELEVREAAPDHAEVLVVVVAAMAIGAIVVPVVPGGGVIGPIGFGSGDEIADSDAVSLQSSVTGADREVEIVGEIELDPEVRYTIESDERAHWRTGVYDRYTGDGWVRTGTRSSFSPTETVPTNATVVEQRVRTEVETDRLPAAATPINVAGVAGLEATAQGAPIAPEPLPPGETYTAVSAVSSPEDLGPWREPFAVIQDEYTQLPEDVPDRLHEFTAELLEGEDDPMAQAERIESFLEEEKSYSLDVARPDGDIADQFLFEMDAGYCTYFATTMVAMLRSADVPARMAVGYANGQQVAEDRWVVRGLDSHAWVEVYHPDAGWVAFDPTPAAPRSTARSDRLETARDEDHPAVDTDESADLAYDYEPTPEEPPDTANGSNATNGTNDTVQPPEQNVNPDPGTTPTNETAPNASDLEDYLSDREDDDEEEGPPPMPWERLGLFAIVTTGVVTAAFRLRPSARLRRQLAMRWQRRTGDPVRDVERAQRRVEWALAKAYRPRRPTETAREYRRVVEVLDADPAVGRFFTASERIRFGGLRDPVLADEAVDLADRIVGDVVWIGGRSPLGRAR
ncbi:MAG: transglutaminase TgpA family protein [Halobacteriota archaeon]